MKPYTYTLHSKGQMRNKYNVFYYGEFVFEIWTYDIDNYIKGMNSLYETN